MSVNRAQREIDSREFTEWQAYWQLEPWGDSRGDLRAGMVASTMANLWRGADTPPFTPTDFMPQFDRHGEEANDPDALIAQQQQLLESLTRAAGGAVH